MATVRQAGSAGAGQTAAVVVLFFRIAATVPAWSSGQQARVAYRAPPRGHTPTANDAHAPLDIAVWQAGRDPMNPPLSVPMSLRRTRAKLIRPPNRMSPRDVVSSLRIARRQKHGRIAGKTRWPDRTRSWLPPRRRTSPIFGRCAHRAARRRSARTTRRWRACCARSEPRSSPWCSAFRNWPIREAEHPDLALYTARQVRKGRPRPGQVPERGVVEVKGVGDDACLTAGSGQVSRYWGRYRLVLVTNLRNFVLVGADVEGSPAKLESFTLAEDADDFWRNVEAPRAFARGVGAGLGEYLARMLSHRGRRTWKRTRDAQKPTYANHRDPEQRRP